MNAYARPPTTAAASVIQKNVPPEKPLLRRDLDELIMIRPLVDVAEEFEYPRGLMVDVTDGGLGSTPRGVRFMVPEIGDTPVRAGATMGAGLIRIGGGVGAGAGGGGGLATAGASGASGATGAAGATGTGAAGGAVAEGTGGVCVATDAGSGAAGVSAALGAAGCCPSEPGRPAWAPGRSMTAAGETTSGSLAGV